MKKKDMKIVQKDSKKVVSINDYKDLAFNKECMEPLAACLCLINRHNNGQKFTLNAILKDISYRVWINSDDLEKYRSNIKNSLDKHLKASNYSVEVNDDGETIYVTPPRDQQMMQQQKLDYVLEDLIQVIKTYELGKEFTFEQICNHVNHTDCTADDMKKIRSRFENREKMKTIPAVKISAPRKPKVYMKLK